MAKEEVIFTDGKELNLLLKGNAGRESHIFTSSDVQRVSFSHYKARKLFGLVAYDARRITIIAKGLGTVEFDEPKHKQFFESYLTSLRAFCKANSVTFYDFPAETEKAVS